MARARPSAGKEHAQCEGTIGYVGAWGMLGESRARRTRRSAQNPQPAGGEKKEERSPQSYVRKGRVLRGGYGLPRAPQFPWDEGRDSYSPVFSPEADVRPLSAHTRLARAAAAAAAVIPSILNLTSSHTRDEVIAGSARHVRGAMIGHRAAGGWGEGGAQRRGLGEGGPDGSRLAATAAAAAALSRALLPLEVLPPPAPPAPASSPGPRLGARAPRAALRGGGSEG